MTRLGAVTYLVRDYDEALSWFTRCLGFEMIEDTALGGGKRWVLVAPKAGGARLLLAEVDGAEQESQIGKAGGGRVAFFLYTDDFVASHQTMTDEGVRFREAPRDETYGKVAVFEDLYGNKWDLIEPR
jgi:catechol 2,3-dioxygenase-like lactoylglutathione lyase family enzyme